MTSPLYHLKYRQEHLLHCRIDAASIAQFPLLGEFAEMGGTDYVALRQPIGRGAMYGEVNEIYTSWITDRPSGFTDAEVALFEELQPQLVLAVMAVGNVWIGRALLETYLGRDAATRVLGGNIVRGRTDTIRAVIWYSDLQGFTRLTDTLPRPEILILLNAYVEPVVEAIMAEGGEVLKFMGDGVLASSAAASRPMPAPRPCVPGSEPVRPPQSSQQSVPSAVPPSPGRMWPCTKAKCSMAISVA